MSWSGLSNNQTVSFNNLQDAVDTLVFTQSATIPVSLEQITKTDANIYVYIDTAYNPYSSKASNQLVVKSDLIAATIYTLNASVISAVTACSGAGGWTGTLSFSGGSGIFCNSTSVTILTNLGTFDSEVGNNDFFYLGDYNNSRYYQRDGTAYTATAQASCVTCPS